MRDQGYNPVTCKNTSKWLTQLILKWSFLLSLSSHLLFKDFLAARAGCSAGVFIFTDMLETLYLLIQLIIIIYKLSLSKDYIDTDIHVYVNWW